MFSLENNGIALENWRLIMGLWSIGAYIYAYIGKDDQICNRPANIAATGGYPLFSTWTFLNFV